MRIGTCISQSKLEPSMSSLIDLIRHRETLTDTGMTEMTTIMKERDSQANDRLKLMSVWCNARTRRHVTAHGNYAGPISRSEAVVAQSTGEPNCPPSRPKSSTQANVPSSSAISAQQPSDRKVHPQPSSRPQTVYQIDETATTFGVQESARENEHGTKNFHAQLLRWDTGTDPMTDISPFDPFEKGATKTDNYYPAASDLTICCSNYHTAPPTNASANPPVLPSGDKIQRRWPSVLSERVTRNRYYILTPWRRNPSVKPLGQG